MNKNVLVVEDEASLLNVVVIKLKEAGLNAFGANSVDAALKILKDNKIDLIWLDHYLPKKTGLEFVTILKSDEKFKDITIFLVSNSADLDDMYSYINLGINKYYVKMDSSIIDIISDIKESLKNPTHTKLTHTDARSSDKRSLV